MRLYGIVIKDSDFYDIVSEISLNVEKLDHTNNIFYTDKTVACCSSVYNPIEDEEADWMPYNAELYEYNMFYVDDEWYHEGEEPDNATEGIRASEYKEGKLIKQYFKDY